MNKEQYKEIVRKIIDDSTGIKAVELATQVVLEVHDKCHERQEFDIWNDALDPLIEAGEICELEYSLPAMNWRLKSIFFPKGTTFRMINLEVTGEVG